ncbi:MAG: NUDIX domain-containing protein [Lachnospiraceae bacterium]
MEIIKRLNRELVYKGTVIDMYKDTVQVQNGHIAEWDFIGHKGAAAVIPVMDDGRILMVKQYRNALDRITIEVPAGGRDGVDEPYITCASRELEEETGYASQDLEFLISIQTTVAFCNERIDVFVARNLKKTRQHLDEDECVEVEAYEVKELLDMIYAGKLQDGKTMAAVMAYQLKYGK